MFRYHLNLNCNNLRVKYKENEERKERKKYKEKVEKIVQMALGKIACTSCHVGAIFSISCYNQKVSWSNPWKILKLNFLESCLLDMNFCKS